MTWLLEFWETLTITKVAMGIGLFSVSFALSFIVVGFVIVRIPYNYFSSHYQRDFLPNTTVWVRWGAVILKNLLGLVLVIVGILLSLPGIPGPGILTVLLGIIMLDIPGMRPLEAKIIQRPTVLKAINKLREKYGKPPLLVD